MAPTRIVGAVDIPHQDIPVTNPGHVTENSRDCSSTELADCQSEKFQNLAVEDLELFCKYFAFGCCISF